VNFFEHQDKARRQSGRLIALFILAVSSVALAVGLLAFLVMDDVLALLGASAITAATVLGASGVRTLQLRSGGGEVAKSLGGTLVEPDTTDPLRRRLRNVVEEMAIASGIPVPEIWVLEHEPGINAFAAGYSPADAAIAVTRGALENLNRDELQGVVAHEFSHVFNGDMRLNIRLIGFVYGILVISIAGRKLLMSARYSRRGRDTAAVVAAGMAIFLVGSIGLFFGRLIKAAISRQREYLADASAVQFTRNPDGIGNALKKIGALSHRSYLQADSEEVGHMLFARGVGRQMFQTHPPLEDRILAVDPSFRPEELAELAKSMARHAQARQAKREEAQRRRQAEKKTPGVDPARSVMDLGNLAKQIGKPGVEQALTAAMLAAAIPPVLERAAHSDQWAQELLCCLLLGEDPAIRENQLLMIAREYGAESEAQVRILYDAVSSQDRPMRLALVQMAFPQARRRPEAELVGLMRLLDRLALADGKVSIHEYALTRLVGMLVGDALQPARVRLSGRRKLDQLVPEAAELVAILARHGHPDDEDGARKAFEAGMQEVADWPQAMPAAQARTDRLDHLLARLNKLRPEGREKLVVGLLRCAAADDVVTDDELDFLHIVCALLRVPLPMA